MPAPESAGRRLLGGEGGRCASQQLIDGRGGDWQLPRSGVRGTWCRGGLWRAPHSPGLGPGHGSCPPPAGPGSLLPCPSRLARRGGALPPPPPGPRGLAGVSKVTLWCAAVAAAAGARAQPGLRLGSGSGSSRPGSAPARTTQHPDTQQGPPGRGRIPASLPRRVAGQIAAPVV